MLKKIIKKTRRESLIFNSFYFIFIFLPIVLVIFYLMKYIDYKQGDKIVLVVSSIVFYGYFKIDYLVILFSSIIINYFIAKEIYISKNGGGEHAYLYLVIGISFNICLLIYFKYTNFIVDNFNLFIKTFQLDFEIFLPNIILPLALSFVTFQQIAFLIDCYKNKVKNNNFLDYCLFITFFPQLIAGPIVHHKEMIPQFNNITRNNINYNDIAKGIFIFSIGLFKKVCIADSFAEWVNGGFSVVESGFELSFIHSWATSIGYSFQLYFDFSGYCDMAIGLGLLFGIKLPINFYSPYKALNIAEFWRKWHMTLGRFLKDYLYIPLGGNKINLKFTLINLFIVAFISGIWHGAGWGFAIWGILHGLAMVIHRIYRYMFKNIPDSTFYKIFCLFVTFNFINIAWIFFRSENLKGAFVLLKGMFSLPNINEEIYYMHNIDLILNIIFITISFVIVFAFKNSILLLNNFRANYKSCIMIYTLLYISIIVMGLSKTTRFLYFNF